ncbi:MAG: Arc family DNA-binding protein [Cyclobacteriaceae bacterium]|jgi:plasmid stability protein
MANITIRNIPESIFKKIKTLSKIEKRSINSELLMIIENGLKLKEVIENDKKINISKETQIELWESFTGSWEDTRETETIIENIYKHRTEGRDVSL